MAERAYFDTSVLLKRYLAEAGATAARRLLRQYRPLSCAIAPLEAFSALSRRARAGELSEKAFRTIAAQLNIDRTYWELIEVNQAVLDLAEKTIRQTNVRTLDAVHLGAVLWLHQAARIRVPFLTADAQQAAAATVHDLDVVLVSTR